MQRKARQGKQQSSSTSSAQHQQHQQPKSQPQKRPQKKKRQNNKNKKKKPTTIASTSSVFIGPQYRKGQLWDLQSLPREVLYHVLTFVGPRHVITCVLRLNRYFYDMGTDSLLWKEFCAPYTGTLEQMKSIKNLTWQAKWKRVINASTRRRGRCRGLDKLCFPPLEKGSRKQRALFKVCLIGDSGVGKTSLLNRYIKDEFNDTYQKSTIQPCFITKVVEVQGREFHIQIWDTAGPERFQSLGPVFYRGADGIVLSFDLVQSSYYREKPAASLKQWFKFFGEMTFFEPDQEKNFPVVVSGNKLDLCLNDGIILKQEREVIAWCDQMQVPYIKTSAKDGTNVSEAFDMLLEQMVIEHVLKEQKIYIGPQQGEDDDAITTTNKGSKRRLMRLIVFFVLVSFFIYIIVLLLPIAAAVQQQTTT